MFPRFWLKGRQAANQRSALLVMVAARPAWHFSITALFCQVRNKCLRRRSGLAAQQPIKPFCDFRLANLA